MRAILYIAMLAALAPGQTRAQAAARVLYQVDPNLPQAIVDHVGDVLARSAEVVGVDAQARPGDVAVGAERALAGGRPIVRITFYDAVSGAMLFADELPMRGGTLGIVFDDVITRRLRSALAKLASNRERAPEQEPDAARDAPAAAEGEGADAQAVPEDDERPVALELGFGAGAGMHESKVPLANADEHVGMSAFPAYDIGLHADGVADGGVTPGVHFAYRSSVGYTLTEKPPNGAKSTSAARTHELRVEAVVNFNFGHSRRAVSLPLSLGYAFTNLRIDSELSMIHRYTLSGPHLALSLRIPIADGSAVLRLGPDAGVILLVSDGLRRAGIGGTGYAFGGEAELLVRVSERFALRAVYREAHVLLSSATSPQAFSDVQRFITAGLALVY